jgi:hypothetical protein
MLPADIACHATGVTGKPSTQWKALVGYFSEACLADKVQINHQGKDQADDKYRENNHQLFHNAPPTSFLTPLVP